MSIRHGMRWMSIGHWGERIERFLARNHARLRQAAEATGTTTTTMAATTTVATAMVTMAATITTTATATATTVVTPTMIATVTTTDRVARHIVGVGPRGAERVGDRDD